MHRLGEMQNNTIRVNYQREYYMQARNINGNGINLYNLLTCFFVIWPFFWNIWGVCRFTAAIGTSIPIYVLWISTFGMLLMIRKIKISFLFIWFMFLGVIIAESLFRPGTGSVDLSVIFCGALVCVLMLNRKVNYRLLLKCLYILGFIVALSVIFDNMFGLFNEWLISFYTAQYQAVKLRLTATGGLLPHTASAGCYIYSGLAAYITKQKIENRKWNHAGQWLVILIFSMAVLLIQKRGFIIDMVIVIAVITFLKQKKEKIGKLDLHILEKGILAVGFLMIILLILYSRIPMIRDAFDALIQKFTEEDSTLSGRTDLYQLAFSLFQGHALMGIGWGKFRLSTEGFFGLANVNYAVHNVYIQLLCETGIIGFGAFLLAVGSSFGYGMKKYRKIIKENVCIPEKSIIELGIAIQIFFLGYCASGNPLYDYNFCITYFIGIMLTLIPIGKGVKNLCI